MNLLVFILAAWGMTNILVYGKIFDKVRPRYSFFHCPMCIGFHVGWLLYLLFEYADMINAGNLYAGMFIHACISSATSDALIRYFSGLPEDVDGLSTEELHDEWNEAQSD